ncbi:MAG TPA: PAS domain S-box protein [Gemmatimonadaceae bacterium]|nr:PAS domain S-box protein [Gemmatimonadaceae bacterium]
MTRPSSGPAQSIRVAKEHRYFEQLFESAPEAMALLDAEQRVLRINSHFSDLFEYAAAEALDQVLDDLIVPAPQREEAVFFALQLAGGGTVSAESQRRTKSGRIVPVSILSTPFVNDEGERVFFAAYRDISPQVRATAALENTTRRFQSLLENATDMVSIFDAAGRRVYVSNSMVKTLGITEDELLKERARDTVHPDDANAVGEFLRWLAEHPGESRPIEFRRKNGDGEWRLLSAVGKSLLHDPAIAGVVFNSRDVTDERALAEQLRRAQKMEAIGRLAAGISHDFNNLLTVIGVFTELTLSDPVLSDDHRADLTEVKKAVDRAAGLTRQLLAFGGSQVLKPTAVCLNEKIADMVAPLTRLFGPTIELQVVAGADLWTVHADPGQLDQVLLNLALNARDAMPHGGRLMFTTGNCTIASPRPDVDADDLIPAGQYTVLRVSDTGTGMDADTQCKIFEPFFTTKRKGEGTGLGLATAYGIIKQSRGYIKVKSVLGEGTEFAIYLPRTEHSNIRTAKLEALEKPSGGKVLVVDDEPAIVSAISRMLTAAGYDVTVAPNGLEAFELFSTCKGDFDLLVSDLVLPELGGTELAARCKGINSHLKILFVSGCTKDAFCKLEAIPEGTHFLQKPFGKEAVLNSVATVLKR